VKSGDDDFSHTGGGQALYDKSNRQIIWFLTSPVKYFLLTYFSASKNYNSEWKLRYEPHRQVEQTGEPV